MWFWYRDSQENKSWGVLLAFAIPPVLLEDEERVTFVGAFISIILLESFQGDEYIAVFCSY